jgi:FMN phosphatase YigB (HAD superfamily)
MQAILFDLDGTLLDIDLSAFIGRYFRALEAAVAGRFDGVAFLPALSASTEAMMVPHPGETNREAFYRDFMERTGIDMAEQWAFFERFYVEQFPSLAGGAKPAKGGRRAVETSLSLGLKVAVATNPIFPMMAIRHRMSWAGLDDLDIPLVTAYEDMHATKPLPAYYRETAAMLGADPAVCLMVGDDPVLDMAAADIGMRTFYVGGRGDVLADLRGNLDQLADVLPRLAEADG